MLVLIKGDYCPYCKKVMQYINELYDENPNYLNIQMQIIDEITQKNLAMQYRYKLVPSFFFNGRMLFSGIASKNDVRNIFDRVINYR